MALSLMTVLGTAEGSFLFSVVLKLHLLGLTGWDSLQPAAAGGKDRTLSLGLSLGERPAAVPERLPAVVIVVWQSGDIRGSARRVSVNYPEGDAQRRGGVSGFASPSVRGG